MMSTQKEMRGLFWLGGNLRGGIMACVGCEKLTGADFLWRGGTPDNLWSKCCEMKPE